jgi:hypothetical protein
MCLLISSFNDFGIFNIYRNAIVKFVCEQQEEPLKNNRGIEEKIGKFF